MGQKQKLVMQVEPRPRSMRWGYEFAGVQEVEEQNMGEWWLSQPSQEDLNLQHIHSHPGQRMPGADI